jgi:hypothetical protein
MFSFLNGLMLLWKHHICTWLWTVWPDKPDKRKNVIRPCHRSNAGQTFYLTQPNPTRCGSGVGQEFQPRNPKEPDPNSTHYHIKRLYKRADSHFQVRARDPLLAVAFRHSNFLGADKTPAHFQVRVMASPAPGNSISKCGWPGGPHLLSIRKKTWMG